VTLNIVHSEQASLAKIDRD